MFAVLQVKNEYLKLLSKQEKKTSHSPFFIVPTDNIYEVKKTQSKPKVKKFNENNQPNNNDYFYYWLKKVCAKSCKLSEKESDDEEGSAAGHNHHKLLRVYINELTGKHKYNV